MSGRPGDNGSSQEGGVVVNGMSLHARDSGKANSALLCDVRCEDFGSATCWRTVFQEKYESQAFRLAGGRAAGRHLGRVPRRQAPPGGRLPSGFCSGSLAAGHA